MTTLRSQTRLTKRRAILLTYPAGLELIEIRFCLRSAGIEGVHLHAQRPVDNSSPVFFFFFFKNGAVYIWQNT